MVKQIITKKYPLITKSNKGNAKGSNAIGKNNVAPGAEAYNPGKIPPNVSTYSIRTHLEMEIGGINPTSYTYNTASTWFTFLQSSSDQKFERLRLHSICCWTDYVKNIARTPAAEVELPWVRMNVSWPLPYKQYKMNGAARQEVPGGTNAVYGEAMEVNERATVGIKLANDVWVYDKDYNFFAIMASSTRVLVRIDAEFF